MGLIESLLEPIRGFLSPVFTVIPEQWFWAIIGFTIGFLTTRKLLIWIGNHWCWAVGTAFLFVGDLNKAAQDVGRMAEKFSAVNHPTLRKIFGLICHRFAIIRLNPPSMKKVKTIIMVPPQIYAKKDGRHYRIMDNDSVKGSAVFGSEECKDHVTSELRKRIFSADLAVVVTSTQGGHAAFLTEGYLRLVKSGMRAGKVILVLVETTPAREVQTLNTEFACSHPYNLAFADLIILVRQYDDEGEKKAVNNMLAKLLLAIGSGKVEGQDFNDFIPRLASKLAYIVNMSKVSSHALALQGEVEFVSKFLKRGDPDAAKESVWLRDVTVDLKSRGCGLVVVEPEGYRLMGLFSERLENELGLKVDARMGVEWRLNGVDVFLLMPFNLPELVQTDVGSRLKGAVEVFSRGGRAVEAKG
jgi:hypothetical protein